MNGVGYHLITTARIIEDEDPADIITPANFGHVSLHFTTVNPNEDNPELCVLQTLMTYVTSAFPHITMGMVKDYYIYKIEQTNFVEVWFAIVFESMIMKELTSGRQRGINFFI